MKALSALESALQEVFDPFHKAQDGVYRGVARRVRAKLQAGEFDILPANYCESCPVRQRVDHDRVARRPWFTKPHSRLEKW